VTFPSYTPWCGSWPTTTTFVWWHGVSSSAPEDLTVWWVDLVSQVAFVLDATLGLPPVFCELVRELFPVAILRVRRVSPAHEPPGNQPLRLQAQGLPDPNACSAAAFTMPSTGEGVRHLVLAEPVIE
jgi:hypothetical protein